MIRPITVLSLFDGISCGQEALRQLGVPIERYFASEIDLDAKRIAWKNFPNTLQLGDVKKINTERLPKIDLLLGGSPCQGFSTAGKRKGFNDPRSMLLYEYVRVYKELKKANPKITFLLENVSLVPADKKRVDKLLGVVGIEINSSSLCAQRRVRTYWSNRKITTPKTISTLVAKDVITEVVDGWKTIPFTKRSERLKGIFRSKNGFVGRGELHTASEHVYTNKESKIPTLTTNYGCKLIHDNGYYYRDATVMELERIQGLPDGYVGLPYRRTLKVVGNGWNIQTIKYILKQIL